MSHRFVPAVSTGHQLVAGPATPGTSDAVVPATGRVNTATVIRIRLRDEQGNLLEVAGASTVTARVTGANPVTQTEIPFSATDGYRFTYTPSVAGTDTITVRYGGVQVSGSPYTSVVTTSTGGFHSGSLRVGYMGSSDFTVGTGPQLTAGTWDTREPIFRLVHGYFTKAELESAIAVARAKDILIAATFPSNPGAFTDATGDCRRYNDSKWLTEFATFVGSSIITQALKDRVLVWYGPDEPWHSHFCGTFTPLIVRTNFRRMKTEWPDSITIGRIEPHMLRGWGSNTGLPFDYFDKMDYAYATYRGRSRTPSKDMSPRQYFQVARQTAAAAGNYGLVYSHNWANLGDADDCWPAFGPGDTRSGRIHGENGTPSGGIELCSAPVGTETLWMESIQRVLDVTAAAAEDPAAPFVSNWRHAAVALGATFEAFQKRADRVQMDIDAIRIGESRAVFTGWRTPK